MALTTSVLLFAAAAAVSPGVATWSAIAHILERPRPGYNYSAVASISWAPPACHLLPGAPGAYGKYCNASTSAAACGQLNATCEWGSGNTTAVCDLKPGAPAAYKPACEAAKTEAACDALERTCTWGGAPGPSPPPPPPGPPGPPTPPVPPPGPAPGLKCTCSAATDGPCADTDHCSTDGCICNNCRSKLIDHCRCVVIQNSPFSMQNP